MNNEEFQELVLNSLKELTAGINKLEVGQKNLELGLSKLEVGQKEHTEILKALEHRSQINSAEIEKMTNDIVHIKGDVIHIRKDLSRIEIATANNWVDIAKLKDAR